MNLDQTKSIAIDGEVSIIDRYGIFHCETFLGNIITKDKAELMLLIEGAINEAMK